MKVFNGLPTVQTMIDSYRNISFYGEKRGLADSIYYNTQLAQDLEALEATGKLGENNNYESKYCSKVHDIFSRQANCASAFICGPANFNNRRNQKKWDSRDNAIQHLDHWRSKYFSAVNRERTLSPEEEIDKAIARLEYLETEKAKPSGYNHRYLSDKENYDKDNYCCVYNVTTKIRETKKKIIVMKNRIEAKASFKPINFEGGSVYIENDRVIINHDVKPEREVIQAIKKHGFRWSPKMGNWCRKHTRNALYDAQNLVTSVFGGEVTA